MPGATAKTLARHLDAIVSGRVDKTNVIGMRKAINLAERKSGGWSVPKHAPTLAQTFVLEEALAVHEPTVMGELHDTGLALLRSRRYAKRLAPVADIIHGSHVAFRLVRYDRIGRHDEYAVPVYRCVGFGKSFLFRNIPWQSGGNGPEILEA